MKSSSIISFLLLAFVSVSAAPVVNYDLQSRSVILESRALSPSAQKVVKYIKENGGKTGKVNSKTLCFYSGFTPSPRKGEKPLKVYSQLKAFMAERGCAHDIEVYSNQFELDMAGYLLETKTWTDADWIEVSKTLADAARNKVYVLLGEVVNPQSVWIKEERLRIIKNMNNGAAELWTFHDNGKFEKLGGLPTPKRANSLPVSSSQSGRTGRPSVRR
ncbi:hypothetical protein C8J56DRAFT_1037635 [Mycena floridula]|nr:hypothetical protein C8J56DRAFT_1037635 [Mycena floridula]